MRRGSWNAMQGRQQMRSHQPKRPLELDPSFERQASHTLRRDMCRPGCPKRDIKVGDVAITRIIRMLRLPHGSKSTQILQN